MKIFTILGDGGLIWFVVAALMLCFKKTRTCAIVMLVSLGIGYVLNDFVLKLIFSRPRPFSVHPEFLDFLSQMGIDAPSGYSFPSGHAFSSFNCAMIIFLFHKRLGIGALVLAFFIGLSRIFFCVHYPTDVMAGMVLGVLVAFSVYLMYRAVLKMIQRRNRKRIRELD